MSACDFGETVAVERVHLTALLETLSHTAPVPVPLGTAAQELAHALHGQADADTWLVPAEALWVALHYSHGLDTYDLDECEASSYTHPALLAEDHVQRQLMEQAPRTDAAMEAVSDAGLAILLGVLEHHVPYLYGSATVWRERRCLVCETAYPCQSRRAVESPDEATHT